MHLDPGGDELSVPRLGRWSAQRGRDHDAAVAGRMDYSYYYDAARNALDLHASILSEENHEWLRSLPYDVREKDLYFCLPAR